VSFDLEGALRRAWACESEEEKRVLYGFALHVECPTCCAPKGASCRFVSARALLNLRPTPIPGEVCLLPGVIGPDDSIRRAHQRRIDMVLKLATVGSVVITVDAKVAELFARAQEWIRAMDTDDLTTKTDDDSKKGPN
jgi:hypothetical protein